MQRKGRTRKGKWGITDCVWLPSGQDDRDGPAPALTLLSVPLQSMYQSYGSPSQYGVASSYGSATPQQSSAPQHQGTLNQVMPVPGSSEC